MCALDCASVTPALYLIVGLDGGVSLRVCVCLCMCVKGRRSIAWVVRIVRSSLG